MSDLAALFDKVEAHIQGGIVALDSGEVVDLSGLDVDVQTLCQHVNELPAEQAATQLARLQQVMTTLDELSERLKTEQQQVRAQIDGLNQQKKAVAAYGAAPKGGKPKADSEPTE